jgi:hypothetical protein
MGGLPIYFGGRALGEMGKGYLGSGVYLFRRVSIPIWVLGVGGIGASNWVPAAMDLMVRL